jgi:hypothetical protein
MIDIDGFNQKVKEARNEEKEPEPEITIRRKIEYLVPDGYFADLWPADFVYPPLVGDGIESTEGNRLKIGEIIHRANGVTIKLIRDTGGISPMGGGGSASERDW